MSAGKSALIFGATGSTGRHLLRELLASPTFTRVGEYGRHVTPAEQLTAGKDKLEQKTVDYEKLDAAALRAGKWDVVFITVGTTMKNAGGPEAFTRIDHDYVVNAARAAKTDDEAHAQRLIYLSSSMAKHTARSFYLRSKGQTERDLAALGYSDTIAFRPGFLGNTHRELRNDKRLMETLIVPVMKAVSFFSDGWYCNVDPLAAAMRVAGEVGSTGLLSSHKEGEEHATYTVLENHDILSLLRAKGLAE